MCAWVCSIVVLIARFIWTPVISGVLQGYPLMRGIPLDLSLTTKISGMFIKLQLGLLGWGHRSLLNLD